MTNPDPRALTDAAKEEIRAAIAIVREDRMEKYMRSRLEHHTNRPADPPTPPTPTGAPTPPVPPTPTGGPTPPPPVPPNAPPTPPEGERKRGVYWGDALED